MIGKIPNLLIVSGLGRNIGKTELASQLIKQQSQQGPVYGIKVSVIGPDHSSLISCQQNSSYQIFEETNPNSVKDTSRMLRSGARKVFYLQTDNQGISLAFPRLLKLVEQKLPIICESNSLGDFFTPGLHLLIAGVEHRPESNKERIERADLCLLSDKKSGFRDLDRIVFSDNSWRLRDKK